MATDTVRLMTGSARYHLLFSFTPSISPALRRLTPSLFGSLPMWSLVSSTALLSVTALSLVLNCPVPIPRLC